MTEVPSFDNFLAEIKASLAHTGGDAVLQRINAERLLQMVAERLIEDQRAKRIRILSENRFAEVGEIGGADFLFQIDDYDIRVELLHAPEGRLMLDLQQLERFRKLLEDNPSTVYLLLTWTTDDLLSVAFTLARIDYLIQHPEHISRLLKKEARPLAETLTGLIERQEKTWAVELQVDTQMRIETANYSQLFEEAFEDTVQKERGRSYRDALRKEAARRFSMRSEQALVMEVFREAMRGKPVDMLFQKLQHIS